MSRGSLVDTGLPFLCNFPGKEREQEEDGMRAPPEEKGGIP